MCSDSTAAATSGGRMASPTVWRRGERRRHAGGDQGGAIVMMTGEEYRQSLDDGRATYFEGQRVDDIPKHPILGQCVERVAEGYDWLYSTEPDVVSPLMAI